MLHVVPSFLVQSLTTFPPFREDLFSEETWKKKWHSSWIVLVFGFVYVSPRVCLQAMPGLTWIHGYPLWQFNLFWFLSYIKSTIKVSILWIFTRRCWFCCFVAFIHMNCFDTQEIWFWILGWGENERFSFFLSLILTWNFPLLFLTRLIGKNWNSTVQSIVVKMQPAIAWRNNLLQTNERWSYPQTWEHWATQEDICWWTERYLWIKEFFVFLMI